MSRSISYFIFVSTASSLQQALLNTVPTARLHASPPCWSRTLRIAPEVCWCRGVVSRKLRLPQTHKSLCIIFGTTISITIPTFSSFIRFKSSLEIALFAYDLVGRSNLFRSPLVRSSSKNKTRCNIYTRITSTKTYPFEAGVSYFARKVELLTSLL